MVHEPNYRKRTSSPAIHERKLDPITTAEFFIVEGLPVGDAVPVGIGIVMLVPLIPTPPGIVMFVLPASVWFLGVIAAILYPSHSASLASGHEDSTQMACSCGPCSLIAGVGGEQRKPKRELSASPPARRSDSATPNEAPARAACS